jgi:hypothetical protein
MHNSLNLTSKNIGARVGFNTKNVEYSTLDNKDSIDNRERGYEIKVDQRLIQAEIE